MLIRFMLQKIPLVINYPLRHKSSVSKERLRILFFGSDEFSVWSLKYLNENRINTSVSVIKNLDVVALKGHTPVRVYAQKNGLSVHDWRADFPKDAKFDVGVVVSFGRLIPESIIKIFPRGILNVHPSLLPRWRGSSPIIHTILNGDAETGITITEIKPKSFDVGPILLQKAIPLSSKTTRAELSHYLAEEGAKMLLDCLSNLDTIKAVNQQQTKLNISYAYKVKSEMGKVDWSGSTVNEIYRQYRALGDTLNLRSIYNGRPVRLLDMIDPDEINDNEVEVSVKNKYDIHEDKTPSGLPYYCKKSDVLYIKCKDGWCGFKNIMIKKVMSASSFYNGYLSKPKYLDERFQSFEQQKFESKVS